MIRLDDVRGRLDAQVSAISGRVGNAGDFAGLVKRNALPQLTPAAFVLPGGLRGGVSDAVAGLFRQEFDETVIVVLVSRVASDPLGDKAIDELTPLINGVVEAVAGWAPADAIGVFELGQGELVGAMDGAIVFQIDFRLNDQLRIAT